MTKRKWVISGVGFVVLAAVAILLVRQLPGMSPNAGGRTPPASAGSPMWNEHGLAVADRYNASVTAVGGGKYRMFFSSPEGSGTRGVVSATSSDGLTWTADPGIRLANGTVAHAVVHLADGRYRVYYEKFPDNSNAPSERAAFYSAVSTDGYSFTPEAGIRLTKGSGTDQDVAGMDFPTVVQLKDGSWLMAYDGHSGQHWTPPAQGGNGGAPAAGTAASEAEIMWATSPDGLTWTKKGVAVDSHNATWNAETASPYLVSWDDGTARLFFYGGQVCGSGVNPACSGIWHADFTGSGFSTDVKIDLSMLTIADRPAPNGPNPPGDPAVARVNGTWVIYFDQASFGVFSATPCSGPCPQRSP